MKRGTWALALALMMVAVSPVSASQTVGGVTMPERITAFGTELTLNGMGIRQATWLRVDVYVAGLYVEEPSQNAEFLIDSEQVKVMRLEFVRSVSESDMAEALEEGFQSSAENYAAIQDDVAQVIGWLSSFSSGDTLTFSYLPGRGVHVAVNGETRGITGDAAFGRALIGIWLGDDPPNERLKRGLLGL
jgi:hypothetical protein